MWHKEDGRNSTTKGQFYCTVHERPSQITRNTYQKRKDVKARTIYLLGNSQWRILSCLSTTMCLPRFLAVHQEFWCKKTAADIVASEIINVWQQHLGLRMTHGKETIEKKTENEKVSLRVWENTVLQAPFWSRSSMPPILLSPPVVFDPTTSSVCSCWSYSPRRK